MNSDKWKQFILEEYIPSSSIEEHNISFIQERENIDRESAERFVQEVSKDSVWLKDYKIEQIIGFGVQGRVYGFENENFVLKIFKSDMFFQRDMNRVEKIMAQMFGKEGSLEDMHYFDVGTVSGLYTMDGAEIKLSYIIMPKINLVKDTPEFKSNKRNNQQFFTNIQGFATDNATREITFSDATDFKEQFLKYIKKISEDPNPQRSFINFAINFDFPKKADAYLNAAYRAYTQGGFDLHSGNIGFFPTSPDKFFYFDM